MFVISEMNNMKKWIPTFLSNFHKSVMKPLGYKKNDRTFSKDKGTYWERIWFQGGRWIPYSFHINIGIEFKDVHDYDTKHNFILMPSTHWAKRIHELIPKAPSQWLFEEDRDQAQLSEQLTTLITQASELIETRIDSIREELNVRLKIMAERRKASRRDEQ